MVQQIHLASRPQGWPTPANFSLVEVELPKLGADEVQVKNLFMSVDPYMRGRMNDVKGYVPPFQVGQALDGAAVGEVVASSSPNVKVGDVVTSQLGWRDQFVTDAGNVKVVDKNVTPTAYLGVLGVNGLTAWAGLRLVDVKAGDRVFISAAAGATGIIAGQLAKLRGCHVVGSAGSAAKVKMLTEELGFDAAFNYKDGELVKQLKQAAPEGIDVYFDNVGGDHLEAAIAAMRLFGRIIACGAISGYNDATPQPGPRNLSHMIGKRLTMKGFIVIDSFPHMNDFLAEIGPLFAQGQIKAKETVVEGLAQAPHAFLDLLRGGNTGKMIVKLA